ncbi:MAG: hypothetical protein NT175_09800 [Bacteroidetes bacterium]|nr:hypothetical protein [Bacteroidota bacterium]
MKKVLFILIALSMSFIVMAQEKPKQKEVGLAFSSLNNFGLTFRTGTNKSLWRFNTLLILGSNRTQNEDSSELITNSIGFDTRIGKEYRKNIAENLELRYGADLSFSFDYSKYDHNDKSADNEDRLSESTTYRPGINALFGLNYVINNKFVIGAELLPGFSYLIGKTTQKNISNNESQEVKTDNSGFNYGLSNTSALLSITYRFF